MDNQPTERDKYLNNLYQQLDKAQAAGHFQNDAGGQLVIEMLNADVARFTSDVASDKFINDHNGYLDSRAKLSYSVSLLKRLNNLANPDLPAKLQDQIKAALPETDQPNA